MLTLGTVDPLARSVAAMAILHALACGRVGYDRLEQASLVDATSEDLQCPAGCNATATSQPFCYCSDSQNWSSALDHCRSSGLTLLRIDSAAENAEVESLDSVLWLGASDVLNEGQWRWTDNDTFWLGAETGSAVDSLYNNWELDQPNNLEGAENCAEMESDGDWNDTECDAIKDFLCE